MHLTLGFDPNNPASKPPLGDLNGGEKAAADTTDVTILRRIAAGTLAWQSCPRDNADVNRNWTVDATDVTI